MQLLVVARGFCLYSGEYKSVCGGRVGDRRVRVSGVLPCEAFEIGGREGFMVKLFRGLTSFLRGGKGGGR